MIDTSEDKTILKLINLNNNEVLLSADANNKPTAGGVAIEKKNLIELIKNIRNDTIITII